MLIRNAFLLTSRVPVAPAAGGLHTCRPTAVRKNSFSNADQTENEDERLGHDDDHQNVLKVVQRFARDPTEWPEDEKPFAMIDRNFLGKVMSPVELRPERGFANFVPIGTMLFRHMFRKVQAKANFRVFEHTGIFDEDAIRAGTKKAFELISQNAYNRTLFDLVSRGVCAQATVDRFESASRHMERRQRALLNITEDDIYAIAPGVLGPYQYIRPVMYQGKAHLARALLCCAYYKKKLLFDQVDRLPLLSKPTPFDRIPLPAEYGYAAPRLIFGFITFGNRAMEGRDLDSEVKLLDFQYLIL